MERKMITIKILTGPHAGKVRELHDNVHEGVEINPLDLLWSLVLMKATWEIDYSQATKNEILDWARADITRRAMRALVKGLPVEFQGVKYSLSKTSDLVIVAGELEDVLVQSGMNIFIGKDDETGVLISCHSTEHQVQ